MAVWELPPEIRKRGRATAATPHHLDQEVNVSGILGSGNFGSSAMGQAQAQAHINSVVGGQRAAMAAEAAKQAMPSKAEYKEDYDRMSRGLRAMLDHKTTYDGFESRSDLAAHNSFERRYPNAYKM